VKFQAFTARASGRVNVLKTPVKVFEAFDPRTQKPGPGYEFWAIWDTGATNSVISQKVVDALRIRPTGFATVKHAQGTADDVETYFVNIWLPNGVGMSMVRVTKGVVPDADLLIGMDIISKGDFAITQHQGKTTFSFRVPSCEEIDFVKPAPPTPVHSEKVSRNSPCPCGSGKKYKLCCGQPK
jgi:hypothetical protein